MCAIVGKKIAWVINTITNTWEKRIAGSQSDLKEIQEKNTQIDWLEAKRPKHRKITRIVLTISLPPCKIIPNMLVSRVKHNSSVKRRRVLQRDTRKIFWPMKHIGRCEVGCKRWDYFRLSAVVERCCFAQEEAILLECLISSSLTKFGCQDNFWSYYESENCQMAIAGTSHQIEWIRSLLKGKSRTFWQLQGWQANSQKLTTLLVGSNGAG